MSMNQPTSDNAGGLSSMLHSRGAVFRFGALLVGLIAMFLPAISGAVFGTNSSAPTIQVAPWSILFPILVAAALAAPGIPAVARYSVIFDIAAVLAGTIAIGYIVIWGMQAMNDLGKVGALASSLGGDAAGLDLSRIASLGFDFGVYVLGLAVAIAVVPIFRRG